VCLPHFIVLSRSSVFKFGIVSRRTKKSTQNNKAELFENIRRKKMKIIFKIIWLLVVVAIFCDIFINFIILNLYFHKKSASKVVFLLFMPFKCL
jgi:hypothetical protein